MGHAPGAHAQGMLPTTQERHALVIKNTVHVQMHALAWRYLTLGTSQKHNHLAVDQSGTYTPHSSKHD